MKPDCRNALQRKRHERLLGRYSGTFLRSGLNAKVAEFAGILGSS
jgi:hypothetical protein